MKRIAIACLLMLAAGAEAEASLKMRGTMVVTAVSAVCIDNDVVRAGQIYSFRYRPPNVGGNGPNTSISILAPFEAMNFNLPTGSLIGTTYQTVNVTGIFSGAGTWTAGMRIPTHTPAVVSDSTTMVTMRGNILDFAGEVGCTVTFAADAYK
jgi:hypothetical protein